MTTVDVTAVQIEITELEKLPVSASRETPPPLRDCDQLTCGQFTCQGTCKFTD